MKNILLILILLLPLRGSSSELSKPDHYGPVSIKSVKVEFGEESIIHFDDELGSAHRIIPQNDPHDQELDFQRRSIKYIDENPDIFRTPEDEIKLEVHEKYGHVDYVIFRQTFEHIPVYQSRIDFRYSKNKLVWFGADTYPDIDINATPSIDSDMALLLAEGEIEFDSGNKDFVMNVPELFIYAHSLGEYQLAWRVGLFVHHRDSNRFERSVSNFLIL